MVQKSGGLVDGEKPVKYVIDSDWVTALHIDPVTTVILLGQPDSGGP
jgi:hypothetical protein